MYHHVSPFHGRLNVGLQMPDASHPPPNPKTSPPQNGSPSHRHGLVLQGGEGLGPVFQGAVRATGGGLPTLPRRAKGTGGAGPMAGGPGANES